MNDSPIKSFRDRNGKMSLETFGAMFSVNKSTVMRWEDKVPAERVLDIEGKTGIPRQLLRPDLYPVGEVAA
jgi:DNA-binding transcriptional regulator YdaS (Cro superfamily)